MAGHKPQPTPAQLAKALEQTITKWEAFCQTVEAQYLEWAAKEPRPLVDLQRLQFALAARKDTEGVMKILPKQIDPTTGICYASDCLQMRRLQALLDKVNPIISALQAASKTQSVAASTAHVMPGAPGRTASASASSGLETDVSKLHA